MWTQGRLADLAGILDTAVLGWKCSILVHGGKKIAESDARFDVSPFETLASVRQRMATNYFPDNGFTFVVAGDKVIARVDEADLLFIEAKPCAMYFSGITVHDPLPSWAARFEGYAPNGGLLNVRDHSGITPDASITGIIESFYKNEWAHSNLHSFAG